MSGDITLEDLMEAIAEAEKPNTVQRGMTAKELAAAWGLTEHSTSQRIKRAKAAGLLHVGKKRGESVCGSATTVPCYWFAKPKEPQQEPSAKTRKKP